MNWQCSLTFYSLFYFSYLLVHYKARKPKDNARSRRTQQISAPGATSFDAAGDQCKDFTILIRPILESL